MQENQENEYVPQETKKYPVTEVRDALYNMDIHVPGEVVEQFVAAGRAPGCYTRRWGGRDYPDTPTFHSAAKEHNIAIIEESYGMHRNMELLMEAYAFFTMKGCSVSLHGQESFIHSVPDLLIESGEFLKEISGGRQILVSVHSISGKDEIRMLKSLANAIRTGRYLLMVSDSIDIEEFEQKEIVGDFVWYINDTNQRIDGGPSRYPHNHELMTEINPKTDFPRKIEDADWGVMSILFVDDSLIENLEKKLERRARIAAKKAATQVQTTPPPTPAPVMNITDKPAESLDPPVMHPIPAEPRKQEPLTAIEQVERFLKSDYGPHSADGISAVTGIEKAAVTTNLCRLVDKKCVFKEARGLYYHRKWMVYDEYELVKKEVRAHVDNLM